MSSFTQICRLSNYFVGSYKSVLHGRTNWLAPVQACNYTKKSAEERLGLEKPKRPLTPFFKFMTQMRPALLAKNPGISSKEAISWTSKHWQQLDLETKTQMGKEYEKDLEDYKKIKAMYESSLTDKQKEDIKRVKLELAEAKEKRKLKALHRVKLEASDTTKKKLHPVKLEADPNRVGKRQEYKELGRPKKPMSSYFLFIKSRKEGFKGKDLKQFQEQVKKEWLQLTDTEKAKLDKEAADLMTKYRKELDAWELKMISNGRTDLVRSKSSREKKPKAVAKKQ